MTYEEIIEWAKHDLEMGYKHIETIYGEFIYHAVSGGKSPSSAAKDFDALMSHGYLYSKEMNTLVHVKGMSLRVWLTDHPSFRWVTARKAGEICAREGFMWTYPVDYYGGDPLYEGGSISTALCPDEKFRDLYSTPF